MRVVTLLVLWGTLWAGTANVASAAPQKQSEDSFFRQLRSPFERKLKGTRRGCSAYGHSCFGGYGKRAEVGVGAGARGPQDGDLAPAAPAPDLPLHRLRLQLRLRPERLPYLRSLRSLQDPQDNEEAEFIVLRQSPVSSRTPLWGRPPPPPVPAPARTYNTDDEDNGEAAGAGAGPGGGAVPALNRRLELGADGGEAAEAEPYASMASRLFLRRWLRTYRRAASAGPPSEGGGGEGGARSAARH